MFLRLILPYTQNVQFILNKSLYFQCDGVAMGSPLGPTLANVFMCFHEATWLNDCSLTSNL